MKRDRVTTTVGSVVVAAATGVVINVLSESWALTWWFALGALVAVAAGLQLMDTRAFRTAAPTETRERDGSSWASVPGKRSTGMLVGTAHAGKNMYIAGSVIKNTHHHHGDRGDSRLELSSITQAEPDGQAGSGVVLDLRIRNTGGQPAILHRAVIHIRDALDLSPHHVVGFLPYEELWVRGALPVSHTYDSITLPHPDEARETHDELDLSQAIGPAGTDRFHIRLGTPPAQDTLIYLLDLTLFHDTHGTFSSPAVAVAYPLGSHLVTYVEIREDLAGFLHAVHKVRGAVDREMAALGLPTPNWDNHPPTTRSDLPPGLRSLDGDPDDVLGLRADTYKVNNAFWNPQAALTSRRRQIRSHYEHVVRIIDSASIRHKSWSPILTQAQTILRRLHPPDEPDNHT